MISFSWFHLMKYLTNYGQHQICVVSSYNMRDEIEVTMNFGYFHHCDTTAFVFFSRVQPIIWWMYIKNFILPSWWLLFAFCNWTSVWAVKIYFIITPLLGKAPEEVQISIRYKLFQDNYRWLHALFMQCIQSVPWKIMSLKVSLQNQPSRSNGLVLNNTIPKSILQVSTSYKWK